MYAYRLGDDPISANLFGQQSITSIRGLTEYGKPCSSRQQKVPHTGIRVREMWSPHWRLM